MDPTPQSKIRGDAAGQVSPPPQLKNSSHATGTGRNPSWYLGEPHLLSHTKMLYKCGCDTCFMGYLVRRVQRKHLFLRLTQTEIKVGLRSGQKDQISKHKIVFLRYVYIVQFCLMIPKNVTILMTMIRNAKNRV